MHKVYPLEKLWLESGPNNRHADGGEGKNSGPEHEIRLLMPEASLNVQATNTAEKVITFLG